MKDVECRFHSEIDANQFLQLFFFRNYFCMMTSWRRHPWGFSRYWWRHPWGIPVFIESPRKIKYRINPFNDDVINEKGDSRDDVINGNYPISLMTSSRNSFIGYLVLLLTTTRNPMLNELAACSFTQLFIPVPRAIRVTHYWRIVYLNDFIVMIRPFFTNRVTPVFLKFMSSCWIIHGSLVI